LGNRAATSSATSRRRTRPADFVGIALAYAETAIEDRKGERFGKWIRLAAKRFMADLRRAQRKRRPPFLWSPARANRACEFIQLLPHVEGSWSTSTIKLEPAQVFFIVQLFGFRNFDGTRRFTTALLAVARKNAKSTLAAAIMLYCFCDEPELGPQIISAATTGDQARIVWGVARRMVERCTDLREAFGVEAFANVISRFDIGGTFKPINAKASTQDGLNPSALCFDELHAHKTRDLFDVLRSAAGARKNPLFLYTTTEGYLNPGPWQEVRKFAQLVLEGTVEADHLLALYYAVDDDDFDERAWYKANPLMGITPSITKMRELAKEARELPGALAEFRIKRLNRPAAAGDAWVNLLKWRRCGGAVPLDELVGQPCWAGMDLASTTDMTAWWLVWLLEGHVYAWGRYFVPESAVASRGERGGVAYAPWVAAGHIEVTSGETTDYDLVQQRVLEDCRRFQVQEIAFDRWNANQIVNNLANEGQTMVEFAQGARSYNPAMKYLEEAYIARKLHHGGNPVLAWNAANLVPRRDANMNMAPDRKRSADKIDGMCAMLMALARAVVHNQPAQQSFVAL